MNVLGRSIYALLFGSIFIISCSDTLQVPKPRTYPKIEFPNKSYLIFDAPFCDFKFEYPAYSKVIRDTLFFGEAPLDDCWFDIYFEKFNGNIHCTYYPFSSETELLKLVSDEFKMADKHQVRADYIDEMKISKPNGTTGMIFEIEGATASNLQFYLTDTQKHFLRGALYFQTQARPDSIAPVYDFIKEDIIKLIDSFEWK
ncbi:MAG: hypothetical protein KJP00_06570 [Bacteroidia bacterium]|nr:hypothetical protein [Bacteroidia bacterium]